MIPPKGWRARAAVARARASGPSQTERDIRAQRDALLHQRELLIAAESAKRAPAPVRPVTIAQMLQISDVTPDEDEGEAPEAADAAGPLSDVTEDEDEDEAPASEPPAPVEPEPAAEPAAKPTPKKAAKAPTKKA